MTQLNLAYPVLEGSDAVSKAYGTVELVPLTFIIDKQGNIALGYSASSSSVYPSIRYTGRLVGDALGTMQTENIIQAGSGSQLPNLHRWGDSSAITVDPVDDCTFWYTTEYLKSTGTWNWSTKIASFKFSGCQ